VWLFNSYCCQFDLYVGQNDIQPSKYGKTYDLVSKLLEPYENKGYIVFMDNFYTSPFLFFNLHEDKRIGACGTTRPRKGLPEEILKSKFKKPGDNKVMSYR